MSTTPDTAKKLMTADEFWEFVHRPENLDRDFELIRGEVVEVSRPRHPHGRVAFRFGYLLEKYAERVEWGYVVTESGLVLEEEPDTVVGPDVGFYADTNVFGELDPKWAEVAPILVVEVSSPSDRPGRMNAKIQEYLANGVKVVWQVDFEERNVTVHRPNRSMEVVPESGELLGGDDLPGLTIKVSDAFKLPGGRSPVRPPQTPSPAPPQPPPA
jgi:Uma2 family endonuclease